MLHILNYNFSPALILMLSFISPLFPLRTSKIISSVILLAALIKALTFNTANPWWGEGIHEVLQINTLFLYNNGLPFNHYIASAILMVALLTIIYSLRQDQFTKRELFYSLVSLTGGIMSIFTQSSIHLFLYIEVMTLSSTALIFIGNKPGSQEAGMRYLMIHLLSGSLILSGFVLIGQLQDSLAIGNLAFSIKEFSLGNYLAIGKLLILSGVMINVAAPPFSAWVADSYSKASNLSIIFLTSLTTKINTLILLNHFLGTNLLIYFGLFMALYGMLYAILSQDVNRAVCYALIGKLGIMLIWIGEGSEAAKYSVIILMIGHILYNFILLITHSVIEENLHSFQMSDLGGLFKKMGIMFYGYIIAILNLAYFPLTLTHISKLIMLDYLSQPIDFIVIISNILTTIFGIKMIYYIFFYRSQRQEKIIIQAEAKVVSIITSLALISLSALAHIKIGKLYSSKQIFTLLISSLLFLALKRLLKPTEEDRLLPDMDLLYRKYLRDLIDAIFKLLEKLFHSKLNCLQKVFTYGLDKIENQVTQVHQEGLLIKSSIKNIVVVIILAVIAFLIR